MKDICEENKNLTEFHIETNENISHMSQEMKNVKIVIKANLYDTALLKSKD